MSKRHKVDKYFSNLFVCGPHNHLQILDAHKRMSLLLKLTTLCVENKCNICPYIFTGHQKSANKFTFKRPFQNIQLPNCGLCAPCLESLLYFVRLCYSNYMSCFLEAVARYFLSKWFRCDRAAWRSTVRNTKNIQISPVVRK